MLAMSIRVSADIRKVNDWFNNVNSSMRDRKVLMDRIGGALQKYTQNRIKTQGEGTWPGLAPSTRERTGRSKALVTLIPFIKVRSGAEAVTVYFSKRPKGWSLEQHERGYTSAAVKGPIMKMKKDGSKAAFFSSRKESKVPARRVFPTDNEALRVAIPLVNDWTREIIRRRTL
jgi:hypothetical protein